jgi:hypothetical protein
LDRTYKYFIGKSENKNNISFVVGAWKILLEENTFQSIITVNIWSDGGPKHFKISSNVKMVLNRKSIKKHSEYTHER